MRSDTIRLCHSYEGDHGVKKQWCDLPACEEKIAVEGHERRTKKPGMGGSVMMTKIGTIADVPSR